jgi:hypothetical protein
MVEKIKELTLLLLYLTSWKESDLPDEMRRSWKGYPFETLDELTNEDLIRGSFRSKSVYFTQAGIEEAKKLMNTYLRDLEMN